MKYFRDSNPSSNTPYVDPRQPLPPREWFTPFPEVLTAYDEMTRLNEAIVKHAHEAIACKAKADVADSEYSQAVSEALRAGTDPDTVTNKRDSYLAQAKAHERLSAEAQSEATAHGHRLGRIMQTVAKDVAAAAEERMRDALAELDRIEATKQAYRADIARAWPVRRAMSTLHFVGGGLSQQYTINTTDPREELDTLNAEEAKISERRAKEAHSLASM
ncbi:hypothetical protein AB0O38_16080 [Pseudarthrobacter oxydans]|uniref:hypothetical protein n=1 Tax=Pseudarthrobacter oxydans TaxID=1671 RepID=UPI00341C8487